MDISQLENKTRDELIEMVKEVGISKTAHGLFPAE